MFGKARDIHDTNTLDTSALDEFFGDEAAAENSLEIHDLRDRVRQVESQISSQFTSLATYAQIAHEQIELARSEAKAATERSEHRLTTLIERERADRLTASTDLAPENSADIDSRLDALEHSVSHIQASLDDGRRQQQDLSVTITTLFDRLTASTPTDTDFVEMGNTYYAVDVAPLPAPSFGPPMIGTAVHTTVDVDGPITGLSLDG